MKNSLIITDTGCIVFASGKPFVVNREHPNYNRVIEAFKKSEFDSIEGLVDIEKTITKMVQKSQNPNITIKGRTVYYKHIAFPDDLSEYIINITRDHLDLAPYINFMEKLIKNPDHRVFQQLFGFMAYGKNPITPDGNILAYKKVNENYTSVHDGKTMNTVGTVLEMPREACNANPEETCSTGFHFCSREYINNFNGTRVMVVEVDPADVVSVPVDYNNTKARACRYKIVGELTDIEMQKVMVEDVLEPAAVVDKYSATKDDVVVEQNVPATNEQVKEYLQGYTDGRKKLTKANTGIFYTEGYRAGRSKKKRKYSEADLSGEV